MNQTAISPRKKHQRVPAALQAVFLNSGAGHELTEPPPQRLAARVFGGLWRQRRLRAEKQSTELKKEKELVTKMIVSPARHEHNKLIRKSLRVSGSTVATQNVPTEESSDLHHVTTRTSEVDNHSTSSGHDNDHDDYDDDDDDDVLEDDSSVCTFCEDEMNDLLNFWGSGSSLPWSK